jgi:hypothetical protein
MVCEIEKKAFEDKLTELQSSLSSELAIIAKETEVDLEALADEFEDSQTLGEGVGAIAGTVIGGAVGGPAGAAIGGTIGREVGKLFVIRINEEEVKIILDLPGIAMEDQSWKFDLPEVTTKDSDIIFNAPALVMKTIEGPPISEIVIGSRRECKDLGLLGKHCIDIPTSTIRWKKTYIDVPTYESREQRIVIGVPQVAMKTQEIVVSVPEVTNYQQEFIFTLPVISIEFIQDAGSNLTDKTKDIARKTEAEVASKKATFDDRIRRELIAPANSMFECHRASLVKSKTEVSSFYDSQITVLTNSLALLKSKEVPEDDDDYIAAKGRLDDLVLKRGEQLEKFDIALKQLDEAAKKAIEDLLAG